MSHPAAWRCRSESCRSVLGQVRGGVLYPAVPVALVDGQGVARVVCPQCGRARAWLPSGGALTAEATSSVADPAGSTDSE